MSKTGPLPLFMWKIEEEEPPPFCRTNSVSLRKFRLIAVHSRYAGVFFSFFLRTPTHSCCWNWDPVAVVVWCARQTSPDFWPHYCIGAPNESSLPRAQIIPLGVMVVEGSRADMPNIMTNNTLPMG